MKWRSEEVKNLTKSQILGWVLLGLLGLLALAGLRGSLSSDEEAKENFSNLGDTVLLGNFSYKVNNFEIRNSNDMQDRNDLIVSVDVTSKSEKSENVSFEESFVLKIGDKTFEVDSTRSTNANAGSNPFRYSQLNPDQIIKGFVVFNISKDQAESESFNLLIKEGSFSSGEATVKLQ